MAWGFVAAAAITVVGGAIQGNAAENAANRQAAGNQSAIDEQRAAREAYFERTQPFVDIGLSAGEQLQRLLDDPTQGIDQINPVVSILRDQGFEQIQESAAAGGRLGAGGTLKDLTQYNTDLTTTVIPQLQNQRFNQLFNVLGLGQNAAVGQGTAALQTANQISGYQRDTGRARAEGEINRANAYTNTLSNLSQLWGGYPSQQSQQTGSFTDSNLFGSDGSPSFTMPTF